MSLKLLRLQKWNLIRDLTGIDTSWTFAKRWLDARHVIAAEAAASSLKTRES